MIYLSEVRDWVKTLGLFDGYWIGRLSAKRDNTLGIYPMQGTSRRVCLGGAQFNGYDITAVSFLIHGNNNKDNTERLAWSFYNSVADRSNFLIGDKTVYFVRLLQDCPIDVSGDGDVYEYTIQVEFYTERND
jgi:hypothetical protein